MSEEKKKTRARLACEFCKKRKVKCDVEFSKPCMQCKKKGIECRLSTPLKRGRKPGPLKDKGGEGMTKLQTGIKEAWKVKMRWTEPMMCVMAFQSTLQPFFPFFNFGFQALEATEIWDALNEGMGPSQIQNWNQLFAYLKHALVFVLGSQSLGLATDNMVEFLNTTCDQHFQNIDNIPHQHITDVFEVLLVKSFYHFMNEFDYRYLQTEHLIENIFNNHSEKVFPIITHSILSRRLVNRTTNTSMLMEEIMKLCDILEHPASETVSALYLVMRTLDFHPISGWNSLSKALDSHEINLCINALERAGIVLQNFPHDPDWKNLFEFILCSAKAGIYANTNCINDSLFWVGRALSIANTIIVPGVISTIFLGLLLDSCMKLNLVEYAERVNSLLNSFTKDSNRNLSSDVYTPESQMLNSEDTGRMVICR